MPADPLPTPRPATDLAVGVVLAAGLGTRVGADGNKAYLRLAGRSMVSWSVGAVAAVPELARTVLVHRRGERELAAHALAEDLPGVAVELVEGGDTRHQSEWKVLRHLAADIASGVIGVVVIHDAARPLAEGAQFRLAIETARAHGGAIPGLPAHDVMAVGPAAELDRRDELVRVQTPQAFRAQPLWEAYRRAERDGFEGTDTSSCVSHYALADVHVFAGAATNVKVTFPADVALADELLRARLSLDAS